MFFWVLQQYWWVQVQVTHTMVVLAIEPHPKETDMEPEYKDLQVRNFLVKDSEKPTTVCFRVPNLQFCLFLGKVCVSVCIYILYPNNPCMVYLPTFTIF